MTSPTDRRHERAVARLTDALKKPRIEALLKSWLSAIDDVEEELSGLAVGMTSIDDAEGAQLRVLARIVGSQEVGDDELQRLLVRTRILVVRSSGTGDQLLRILQLLTDTPTLVEYYPATVLVGTLYESSDEAAALVYAFMNRARTAAVRLQLLWTTATEDETFLFADADPLDPVELFESVSGLTCDHFFDYALLDRVGGVAALTAVGTASVETEEELALDLVTGESWARDVLYNARGLHGWVSDSATAGNLSTTVSTLIALAYRVIDRVNGTSYLLAGKRENSANVPGWEFFVSSTGLVQARVDAGAPPAVTLAFNPAQPAVERWRVLLLRHNVTTGQVTLQSVNGSDTEVFVGDPTHTGPLTIGTARGVQALEQGVKWLAVCSGAQVEGLDLQALAQDLEDMLGNGAQTDADRGFAPDDQSAGGRLIDVL